MKQNEGKANIINAKKPPFQHSSIQNYNDFTKRGLISKVELN